MKNIFLQKYINRINDEKVLIKTLLTQEYNIGETNDVNIIYHRELPYTIIVDSKRKFLYKQNIARRTIKSIAFNFIKQDFENCFKSILLPNIINETINFYEVEYFDNDTHKILTPTNLHLLNIAKNKHKILNYCEIIKNNEYISYRRCGICRVEYLSFFERTISKL
jgi:hypothetical protein